MSLSRTEVILCAIVMTVVSKNCCLSVFWIKLSVAVSTEAVASSRTRTLLRFRITLPRQTSWRWPTLQFSPFSNTAIQVKKISEELPNVKGELHDSMWKVRGERKLVALNCMTQCNDIRPGESSFSSFFLTSSPSWQQFKAWNSSKCIFQMFSLFLRKINRLMTT